jgi:hypothetical protein
VPPSVMWVRMASLRAGVSTGVGFGVPVGFGVAVGGGVSVVAEEYLLFSGDLHQITIVGVAPRLPPAREVHDVESWLERQLDGGLPFPGQAVALAFLECPAPPSGRLHRQLILSRDGDREGVRIRGTRESPVLHDSRCRRYPACTANTMAGVKPITGDRFLWKPSDSPLS